MSHDLVHHSPVASHIQRMWQEAISDSPGNLHMHSVVLTFHGWMCVDMLESSIGSYFMEIFVIMMSVTFESIHVHIVVSLCTVCTELIFFPLFFLFLFFVILSLNC